MVGLVVRQSAAGQSGHVTWVHHTYDRIQSYRPGAISRQTDVSIRQVFAPKVIYKKDKKMFMPDITLCKCYDNMPENNINVNCVFAHFQRIFRHHTRVGDARHGHRRTTCCIVHRRSANSHVSICRGFFSLESDNKSHKPSVTFKLNVTLGLLIYMLVHVHKPFRYLNFMFLFMYMVNCVNKSSLKLHKRDLNQLVTII